MSSDEEEPAGGEPPAVDLPEVERHASWSELFFDLVAVAAVASLAHLLATELDWASLGLYAVLFLAVWLAWTTFMLYGNVAGSRTHVLRLLIGMFGLGVMAASVPGVWATSDVHFCNCAKRDSLEYRPAVMLGELWALAQPGP